MSGVISMDDEIMKHRKKKDQCSKSNRRADHKHEYEKIIIYREFDSGYREVYWEKRCSICEREDDLKLAYRCEGLFDETKDFRIKPHPFLKFKYFYSAEELHEKFPNSKIYKIIGYTKDYSDRILERLY